MLKVKAACLTIAIVIGAAGGRAAAGNGKWGANYFPNVTLTTQDGTAVRFYDDLVRGKIVAINLIYTTCQYACPLETARLAQVQKVLGDRMGREVFFYSITIDPEHDTPAVLKAYAEKYHAGPGWQFLTGSRADIELISKKLGLYSAPNPSNPDGHIPYLLVGNETTGQWMRNSATDNPQFLARTIGDWLTSWRNATTTGPTLKEMPRVAFDTGRYMFTSHCAACHTIGRGDHLGPDLRGVTTTRDRAWLTRFIVAPEKVNAAGDPIARGLRAKYDQVRMPNLALTESDAALLIDYIDTQSRARQAASTVEETPKRRSPAPHAAVDLEPILRPYLRIHEALHADRFQGTAADARNVEMEAAKLGWTGEAIRSAAAAFDQAADLKAARAAMGAVSDAILVYAREQDAKIPETISIAYCPMVQKYWLQQGDTIQNPFYGTEMSACGRVVPGIPSLPN